MGYLSGAQNLSASMNGVERLNKCIISHPIFQANFSILHSINLIDVKAPFDKECLRNQNKSICYDQKEYSNLFCITIKGYIILL